MKQNEKLKRHTYVFHRFFHEKKNKRTILNFKYVTVIYQIQLLAYSQ